MLRPVPSRCLVLGFAASLLACQGVIDGEASPGERPPGSDSGGATAGVGPNASNGGATGNGANSHGVGGSVTSAGTTSQGVTPAAPPQFSCDSAADPVELPLPRLSRTQLANTLRFAITRALPEEATAIWDKIAATFQRYPVDLRVPAPGDLKGGYSRADQSIQQSQIDAMYEVGASVAHELTASAARLSEMMGRCASDDDSANDRICLESFVRSWGSRVLRTPLSDEDVGYFAEIAGSTPVDRTAVAEVITTLLNSPGFLYRLEHGSEDGQALSPLSAYELASRLSYQFWQAPPDDALWQAATDGSLLSDRGFAAELERVLESPALESALDEFVSEWLRLDELPSLEALHDDPVYRAFARTPLPTDATRAAMLGDVQWSFRSTLTSGGTISDFLGDRRSYTNDEFLAAVYGAAPWDGTGPAPVFSSEGRPGLLGRAALLATGTASTRPIHKGYLIRNALLCEQVGSPPPNASSMPPVPTESLTTREAVAQLTSGGSCGGCHSAAINPQGFVLEGFDALGRERSEERLFDAGGNVRASPPVDTAAIVSIAGAEWAVNSPVELTRRIDDSRLFHSCIARHYFRFFQGRVESPRNDGCLLSAMESSARSDQPLLSMLKVIANHSTFKNRRFQ
jgi:hypothetical protein